VIDVIGGSCPVQAEGTIDGVPFYFRARGGSWTMAIGGDVLGIPDDPDKNRRPLWYAECTYGRWPMAGWMAEADAYRLVAWCASEYMAQKDLGLLPAPPSDLTPEVTV
jgi:hypothetical protein